MPSYQLPLPWFQNPCLFLSSKLALYEWGHQSSLRSAHHFLFHQYFVFFSVSLLTILSLWNCFQMYYKIPQGKYEPPPSPSPNTMKVREAWLHLCWEFCTAEWDEYSLWSSGRALGFYYSPIWNSDKTVLSYKNTGSARSSWESLGNFPSLAPARGIVLVMPQEERLDWTGVVQRFWAEV